MSKEQIEEMARDICRVKQSCNDVCHPINSCRALKYAERFYNAGYRKQEWISVEERLPNLREEVLVCDEVGEVFTDRIENDGKWGAEISRWWGIKYLYWMPLPEPPKMKGGAE